jgi:hypothetical protein
MTLSKRHAALWLALAIHQSVNPRSIATFNKRSLDRDDFFTTTLPSLGKDLERGLQGRFVLTSAFKKQRNTMLPQFLYELFIQVFDKEGYIRERPSGIRPLRQLLMMFYKFEMPFNDSDVAEANQSFIDRDQCVKNSHWPEGLAETRKIFCSLLPSDPLDIKPHHSNGASSIPISNVYKRTVRRYIPSLMELYGPKYFFNTLQHAKNWCSVNKTVIGHPHSTIVQVPKDSRGPRTICMEPPEIMFIQKGLQTKLYDHIEKYSPAKGYINFTDQSINRQLAYTSSIDRSLVTIDLKDASDMVSWDLLRYLCPPEWYAAFKATRSTHACVDSKNIELKKFAPMGSALCFPVEAMIFWSILRTITSEVWVYGDDIVVRIEYAHDCIKALESYGLLINYDKTLISGFFRESCGADYYKGEDISYIKCKSYDALRYIAFCNLISEAYGFAVSDKMLALHEEEHGPVMRHPLSYRDNPESFVYYTDRLSSSDVFFKRRWNSDYQKFEKRWKKASALPETNKKLKKIEHFYKPVDDDALFDWFTVTNSDLEPESDSDWNIRNKNVFDNLRVDSKRTPVERNTLQRALYTVNKYTWGSDFTDNR